jgi:hypothetical protein
MMYAWVLCLEQRLGSELCPGSLTQLNIVALRAKRLEIRGKRNETSSQILLRVETETCSCSEALAG